MKTMWGRVFVALDAYREEVKMAEETGEQDREQPQAG